MALALAAISPLPFGQQFRFSRPIETPSGWVSLDLPVDVADACRPGLPDLRIVEGTREVPYAFGSETGGAAIRFPLQNVESISKSETMALLNRGRGPALAKSVTLEINAEDFLKPVVMDGSDDRSTWRQVARGSLFSTRGVRWTTLRFPPNDRRYWRFRLDDRNGPAVDPVAVTVEAADDPAPAPRQIAVSGSPIASEEKGVSTLEVLLPAGNLGVTTVRIEAEDPAYMREVRVYERVFFRDEVSRRLVGAGRILRSPGGRPEGEIPVCDFSGRALEIEIEDRDSPPLNSPRFLLFVRSRRIIFHAPRETALTLLYGSTSVEAPRYDLGGAFFAGRPRSLQVASLGPPEDHGEILPAAAPQRGPALETASWRTRRAIALPSTGNIAYLDLERETAEHLAAVRIVDHQNRQVPFIVEQNARLVREEARPKLSQKETRTILALEGLDLPRSIESVELSATAPEYFSRDVTVVEDERDRRGIAGRRILGSARWERLPDEEPSPLRIPIARPSERTIRAEIENGDNAPLAIGPTAVWISRVRIDFPFAPGDPLFLLSDNPEARLPRYDLALVADAVLRSPARPARLAPPERQDEKRAIPKWFWGASAVAAVLVLLALGKALKAEG